MSSAIAQHPAWYGSVMGTGALALALAAQGSTWDQAWLTTVAFVVLLLASALAVLLLPRYLRRFGPGHDLGTEIADPARGPMLATLPAGVLILAVGWGKIAPSVLPQTAALWISGVLLGIGAILAVAFGLTWATHVLRGDITLEGVNGGWLIPPVMNLLVPMGLAPFITANPDHALALVVLGFAFLGIGAILFLAVLTLLVARLALRPPLPAPLAPSMWIPLAPAGLIGLAFLRLEQAAINAQAPGFLSETSGVVVAAMGLGFGAWWAGFAALELRRAHTTSRAPVHPGWWAIVFPVAAMTLSLSAVATATASPILEILGLIATLALVLIWAFVALRTFPMLRVAR